MGARLQDIGLLRPNSVVVFLAVVVLATAVAVTSAGVAYAALDEVECDCGFFQEVWALVESGPGAERKWTVLDNGNLHGVVQGSCPRDECLWVYSSSHPPLFRQIDSLHAWSHPRVEILYWDCQF